MNVATFLPPRVTIFLTRTSPVSECLYSVFFFPSGIVALLRVRCHEAGVWGAVTFSFFAAAFNNFPLPPPYKSAMLNC